MSLIEQVAYLKGLAEGSNLTAEGGHGKFFQELLATLGEMAESVEDMDLAFDDLEEYVMNIDEDLEELEDAFYEDDDLFLDDDLWCSCGCEDEFDDEDIIDVDDEE